MLRAHIYFAIVKTQFPACYFAHGILCYASKPPLGKGKGQKRRNNSSDKTAINFWDLSSGEIRIKYVSTSTFIGVWGSPPSNYSIIAEELKKEEKNEGNEEMMTHLSLCNTIGKPVLRKMIGFIPMFFAIVALHSPHLSFCNASRHANMNKKIDPSICYRCFPPYNLHLAAYPRRESSRYRR